MKEATSPALLVRTCLGAKDVLIVNHRIVFHPAEIQPAVTRARAQEAHYVLTATADTTGWLSTFSSGVKVPLHFTVSGDSVMQKTGTFPSQRRKGMKVMTEGVMRMQDGKFVGTTVAHYVNAGADSVLRLHSEGTKIA